MGLLGKLFEKKYCSICGKEIAILGNKKLRDGNCCGTCEGVLSPYFSERRQASVEEIKHQIRCRTANIEKLRNFNMTRRIGDSVKVMIDEGKNQFIVSDPKYQKVEYPDVIECADIVACVIDVEEKREEIKYEDSNGNVKSFNPPSFAHSFDFYVKIDVNVPYIETIRFKINDKPVDNGQKTRVKITGGLLSNLADAFMPARSNNGKTSNADEVRASAEYIHCEQTASEIRDVLLECRTTARMSRVNEIQRVICPWCGSLVIPDKGGECVRCGGNLDA